MIDLYQSVIVWWLYVCDVLSHLLILLYYRELVRLILVICYLIYLTIKGK